MPAADAPPARPERPLSLSVIFLTLYIDLVGFSIIFPLAPDLLEYYLRIDGHSGVLGWMLGQTETIAHLLGKNEDFAAVLFGGVVSSLFSILQFIFAPFWGALSDRHGRQPVLLTTVLGTGFGYVLWFVSGSFWLFLLSRLVSGAFSGNLSVATAAVADVTTREERSKAMGIVGAAFGLGLVTGPMLGAFASRANLLVSHPSLARYGVNPFSVPALLSAGLCAVNLVWISRRFKETLAPAAHVRGETRLRNPLRAILMLENANARRANIVAFVYSTAFVAMETTLTFLAAERFGYTARENGYLLGFLGVFSIFTQGYLVRKLLQHIDEIRLLAGGLVISGIGLLGIGLAPRVWILYTALAFVAMGYGLVNTSTTGLISLYSGASEQGRNLGIFRSLGSLSRAVTPILAGTVFWVFSSRTTFEIAAVMALGALGLSVRLPKPAK